MALKRATFITYGKDDACTSTKEFIEGSGVTLDIRNLDEKPFTHTELANLVGYLSLSHFLNTASPAFSKNHLDEKLPSRSQVIQMMVDDHTLLRRPIIQTARLITVGCDHQKISEMLQISQNGDGTEENQPNGYGNQRQNNHGGSNRRDRRRSHQQQPASK